MSAIRHLLAVVLVLGSLCLLPGNVRAETYDTCTGFITSLPATISTQGVWCLDRNLSTAITSGAAIKIATNNVTIDCNDFKIGGLAAGDSSVAYGIYTSASQNATVRHCAIRGFYFGIRLAGGAGHLVEDNRLDNNLQYGIYVTGDNNRIRRNAVYDTGGSPGSAFSYGIFADADLIDNTVSGVFAAATTTYPRGIAASGSGNEARGNQVRGLVVAGPGNAYGIYASGSGVTLADNRISADAVLTTSSGIQGYGANTFCTGNTVANFATAYYSCEHNLDNLPAP